MSYHSKLLQSKASRYDLAHPSEASRLVEIFCASFRTWYASDLCKIEKLNLFVEMRYDSSAIFFFHSKKIRNLVAEEALLLHRFSLSSVRVVLYTASSSYSVIPAQLARNWEEALERQFLDPWNPIKKHQERREEGTMVAEISRREPEGHDSRRLGSVERGDTS